MSKDKTTQEVQPKIAHVLFSPIENKDIRESYPELKLIKEFNVLTAKDFQFVWSYVYEFAEVPQERLRIQKAYYQAWGNTQDIDRNESFKNGNIPEKYREAIETLKSYNPSARLKARYIAERQLNFYLQISKTNLEDFKVDGKMQWDEVAKYSQIAKVSNEIIPELIKITEHNYGVSSEVLQEYTEQQGSSLDNFHKLNQQ